MAEPKISRKKLLNEPDEFISLSQHVLLWVHANRSRAVAAAGGAVALVVVALLAKALVDRSRGQRADAVAAAVTRYGDAQGKVADLTRELAELSRTYAGSREGQLAKYLEAGSNVAAGSPDKALATYRELSAEGGAHADLASLSAVALAYLELARGNTDAALSAFQKLLADKGAVLPRAQILMEIASIHERGGRPAEALKVYREIAAAHPEGSWSTPVKERLRVLGGQGPSAS